MTAPPRKPLLLRVSDALRALASDGDSTRAIIPTSFPSLPNGARQMQLVRTADPGEYRRDGRTIRVQGFNAHPVVHACIRVITDILASVPLVVLNERGARDSRVPESHPLQTLLDYPAPRTTARQFRAKFAVDFLGYGNAFFQMERPGDGRPPVALRGVNPESLQQVWIDTEGDARRYDYANWAGLIVNVPSEDMLHFRDIEMGRPFEADVFGYPRGATAIGSILADNEATNYVRQVVTNDGTPTFAVLMADEASTEDAVAMQDRYTARVVDRGKRGVPAFFGAVKDIKPLGFTLSDLEFPDLRRVSREDICAAFGVDPRMIGIGSASNDGGLSGVQYAEARARLVQHTIEPMLTVFEDELNHWLAPEFGDVWVSYDHDALRNLVENDNETSTRVRAEWEAGLRTWEESRDALRLSPVPEPTDTILTTAGRTMIPAAVAVIDPSSITDDDASEDSAEGAVTPDVTPSDAASVAPVEDVQAQALNGAQVTALVELLQSLADGGLPKETVGAIITAAFPLVPSDLVAQMLAPMDAFTPATPPAPEPQPEQEPQRSAQVRRISTREERRAYWERAMQELDRDEQRYKSAAAARLDAERPRVTNAIKTASSATDAAAKVRALYTDGGPFRTEWQDTFTPLVTDTYLTGARQVQGERASFTDTTRADLKAEVLAAIQKRTARLSELIGDTTAREVLAAIRAGELGSLSVSEISRLVARAVYGDDKVDARATTIARTESAGAMSQGAWDQAQAEGDLFRSKTWLSFDDAETRPTHLEQNEMTVGLDEEFPNGLLYPLDPRGDAGEVVNCRCVLAYNDEPA